MDLLLRLHSVCALRCLLERLCLQPAGRATAAAAMTHSHKARTGRRGHIFPLAVTSQPTTSNISCSDEGKHLASTPITPFFKPACCCLHFCRTLVQVANDKCSRFGASRTAGRGSTVVGSSLICLIHLSPTVPSYRDISLMKVSLHSCLLSTQSITCQKHTSPSTNLKICLRPRRLSKHDK